MPVVYDGVADGRGDLFQGLKLWISHRVPQRSRWVDLVKRNGGEVVPLEKMADMLIADNVKRGGAPPPPGAYTWKWIDFSVRNHSLQPKEDYLITAPAPRAVGSSAPAKATRTPFTNHDDLVLTKFVLAKETAGEGTMGNEIYREFERKHPHHPWQSWRERWVKHLSTQRRRNLPTEQSRPELEVSASVAGSPEPGEPGEPAQPAVVPASRTRTRAAQPSRASAPASASKKRPRGKNPFTKEEDELLLEYIRKAQEHNETATGNRIRSLSGNKIYKEFAEEHPSHTWHSWRDRWLRHLCPNDDTQEDEEDLQQEEEEADHHFEEEPQPEVDGHSARSRGLATAKTTPPISHSEASRPGTVALPTSEPSSTKKRPKAKSDDERLARQEQARRKSRAARLLQRTWRGISVRKDCARFETVVVPLQSLVRGYLVRMREAENLLQVSEAKDQLLQDDPDEEDAEQYEDDEQVENGDSGPEEGDADARGARDQFYSDLQDYIDISGAEVDREPVIDGRKIDLWELFRAATRQVGNAEERNWKEVAEELGFDWIKSARCLPKLWECYIQNLAEFEEAIKKRRRLDKKTEIPPTPEDKLGWRKGLVGRRGDHDNSSPLKHASAAAQLFEVDSQADAEELLDGDMDDIEGEDELPEYPHPPKKFVEPETQDFGFDVGGDHGYTTDEDDISPSQQLRTESDMINSPALPSLGRQNAAPTADWRTSGASRPRPAQDPMIRPERSNPRTTVISVTGVLSRPGGPVNGKATKRSLPHVYQKPSSSAPGRPSGFASIRNGTAGLAFAVPPPRAMNGATSRASPGVRSTPIPAMLPSPTPLRPSPGRAPASTAPALLQEQRNGSNLDSDPAAIDAQFAHFEALGYEKAHIGRALEAATFQRGPMTVALQSLHEGRGLPQKEPGVWTDDDDNKLQAIRAYDRRRRRGKLTAGAGEDERQRTWIEMYRARLRAKHGRWMEPRLRFMDMMDAATST
ncbi:hypothetical protein VSDG_08777 [Cytospora chrysosperma]|uniref:DNA-binding protein RAP1 n=1 Tax=Cytospora chrysosperma TaxID=252740 RepID=A0A423VGP7_CYTCH|nr:hypothetical protein VSDG_08777 [Valsa sordida]